MFSYRHGFHAGNHADVLKHTVLTQLINYYNQKEVAYWFIDLHAGAGLYDLGGQWAQKRTEYADGIGKIWDAKNCPAAVREYLDLIKELNPDGQLKIYPGSPWIALDACREQDKFRFFEMHPTEAEILLLNMEQRGGRTLKQATLFAADGFAGLKAHIPPPTRRAIVLIDPSYEDKKDYRRVIDTVREALQRFPTGCYAIWYPQIQRREAQELPRQLEKLGAKSWVHASLTVHKTAADGLGLHGSGMFVINPPWTLAATLKETLPFLEKSLSQDDRSAWKLDYLAD